MKCHPLCLNSRFFTQNNDNDDSEICVATDALVQHHEIGCRDTSITIRVRCDPLSPRPYPVVDAAWVPDSLLFEGLGEVPLEGQSFSIVPRYYSKSAFRLTRFPKNVKYSIESESRHCSLSWLVWDNEIAGFKGIVPFYSEVNGYDRHLANTCRETREITSHSLKIIVQAMLVDDNGSSIRYERILRARLTLNVVPWYTNDNSCETKERSSVPKAYHDKRLASAAQRFVLQGPVGSALELRQSPTGLSRISEGDPLSTQSKYLHIVQVGSQDRSSAMSSSATEAGLEETDLPSSAQTQAYLVAKCTELTREIKIIKEQIMMSGVCGEHRHQTLHVPDSQNDDNDACRHHTGRYESANGSSVPCISHPVSQYLTTPPSPSIRGRDATPQLGPNARFSVLPPPAIGLSSGSHSTSSDVEFVVEQDPRTPNMSRREQANLWNLLSQSDSDNQIQPKPEGEEVRLSEDEKKAMDEAMRRSLDELAKGYDDLFLEDSSESNSGDDL